MNYLDENEECLDNQQTKEETQSLNNKPNISEDPKIFTVEIIKDEISTQSNKDVKEIEPTFAEDITVVATQLEDSNGVINTHIDSLTETAELVGDSTVATTHIESLTLATKPCLEVSTAAKARVDSSTEDLNDKDLSSVASDKELVRKDSREEMFQLNRRKDSQV